MYFPDFHSLKRGAAFRQFREPNEGETEAEFREAFADFMFFVDKVESMEIRAGGEYHNLSAMEKLMMLRGLDPKK